MNEQAVREAAERIAFALKMGFGVEVAEEVVYMEREAFLEVRDGLIDLARAIDPTGGTIGPGPVASPTPSEASGCAAGTANPPAGAGVNRDAPAPLTPTIRPGDTVRHPSSPHVWTVDEVKGGMAYYHRFTFAGNPRWSSCCLDQLERIPDRPSRPRPPGLVRVAPPVRLDGYGTPVMGGES